MAKNTQRTWRGKIAAGIVLTLGASTAIWALWDTSEGPQPASPLSRYIGIERVDLTSGLAATTQTQTRFAAENAQRAVADCMNEAGFDYETSGQRTETNTSEQPDPASRQWAETYGFGVTTLAFSQEQVGQHLTGFNDNTPNPTATTLNAAEANLAIYEQLDTEAKSEYLQALTGDPRVPETVTETIYSPGPNATGCIGELQNRTALQNAFYTEFGDQLDTIRAELNADPRITDHNTLTNACVTAKGLRYTPPDRLYHRWSEDLQAIQDSLDFTTVAGAGARPHLTATAKAQLLTIQAEEADLAIAIHDCGADPATTNTLYTEVAHDLETRFIDNNRDRLDDFKEEHSLD